MFRSSAIISVVLGTAVLGTSLSGQDAVTGSVTYRQRSALPREAVIHVQLQKVEQDVSRADAKAETLGEARISANGRQVPFDFRIPYQPSAINTLHAYAVRASILHESKLLFSSTTSYPVITRGAPTANVAIVVYPVAPATRQSGIKLEGTEWKLTSLGSMKLPADSKATLLFNANGMRLSGSSGCNRLMGAYKRSGSSLRFEPASLTRMACREPLMKRETAFLEALRRTTAYRIEGPSLYLLDGNRTLATFEAPENWLGKWTGPEGTSLDITKKGDGYALTIRSLDGVATFEGAAKGDRIVFTRAGKPESVRPGTGQETGMKWLLDKKNCLVIKTGEGFCRPE